MEIVFLLILSILPIVLIGKYIYNNDKEKEPKGILIKLFLGGLGAIFLTVGITILIGMFYPAIFEMELNVSYIELFFHVFFGVALVEELSKWIFLYSISFNNSNYDQTFDMVVYAVFVALGFAFFENLFYIFDGGLTTAIARALLAIPGHACDGVLMGFYLSLAKISSINGDEASRKRNVYMSILIPTITHGIYDFCLFSGNGILIIGFFMYIIYLYIYVFRKVSYLSKNNYKFKFKNTYCPICGEKVKNNYCLRCGNKNE